MSDWRDYPEYVPVKKRIARAEKASQKKLGKKTTRDPVVIEGRGLAKSFWGKGWCDHMESFHDYENRLPRGRAYARNGSVVHLAVSPGKVEAHVAGTLGLYVVTLDIKTLPRERWEELKSACAGQIASLVDLLQGKLSDGVMGQVARRDGGLFPHPREIDFDCSCPDGASMCKHVAAVCYGVGARLDRAPELLFTLRGVDPADLAAAGAAQGVDAALARGAASAGAKRVAAEDLSAVFGLDLDDDPDATLPTPSGHAPKDKRAVAATKTAAKVKAEAKTKRVAKTAEKTKAKPKAKSSRKTATTDAPAQASPSKTSAEKPATRKKRIAGKAAGKDSPTAKAPASTPKKKDVTRSRRLRRRRDSPEAET